MSLKKKIDEEIKAAMKSQDKDRLRALRSIKSLILLAETSEGQNGELSEEVEIKILTKAAKQRRESAEVYAQQGREDLRSVEAAELTVIEEFLPKALSEEEVRAVLQNVVAQVGATTVKDTGKVMAVAMKELAGKADGKLISSLLKTMLT